MVVVGVQHRAALSAIHGFLHTCYRSLYLSNEFAALKETILLLFESGAQLRVAFRAFLKPKHRWLRRRDAGVRESRRGSEGMSRWCDHVVVRGRYQSRDRFFPAQGS